MPWIQEALDPRKKMPATSDLEHQAAAIPGYSHLQRPPKNQEQEQ